jgi:hypothetical protein
MQNNSAQLSLDHMIPLLFATVVFLGVGSLTLLWPQTVQRFAVWLYEKAGFWPYTVLAQRMKLDFYLVQLRIVGVVCLPVGVLCLWLLWVGLHR